MIKSYDSKKGSLSLLFLLFFNKGDKMNKIEKLKYYDNLYFNEGTSPISDTEYDMLKTSAFMEFENDPYFYSVGSTIDSTFEEIKLPFKMGGLDKEDPGTVENWFKKENDDIVASEKLDGNSIGCSWENGILVFAASRGDGVTGQNIINKIKYCLPNIPIKEFISLRGEVLLEGDQFIELGFKNRRNAVTGLLRRDEINPNILKKLSVVFYEVVEAPLSLNLKTEEDRLNFIQTLKLQVVQYIFIPRDIKNVSIPLEEFLKDVKENSSYDIDGLVLTRNNSIRENVMHPKNKVKFKVNELAKKCIVLDIEWNVTRMGYIKPVILIEPIEIMGVTVSRVSGFNYDFIFTNGIGKGSVIGVVRSGDVIPYVTEIFETATVTMPSKCPDCGFPLVYKSKELICNNPNCFYKNVQETSHFFISMGVDGMSDKTIENIGITTIPGIYNLTKEDLEKLPGFGEKKAELVINEVKKTLLTKPEKLLAAFGMPMIGKTLSKKLCSKFTIDELFKHDEIENLGLGPITSKSLTNNIGKYKELYEFLKSKGLKFEEEDVTTKNLRGIIFTLTGEGPIKRTEIQKLIEGQGGEVKGISRDVNYLVTNDTESTSGKMKSAIKYGTEIISYDELFDSFLEGN